MAQDKAYRQAEKKIEKIRLSGEAKLDLSCHHLTSLPESLCGLTQLQSLDLKHNQLTSLPDWLGLLAQLQWLNLSDNLLTLLPEALGQLAQLRVLSLADNPLWCRPLWTAKLLAHSAFIDG